MRALLPILCLLLAACPKTSEPAPEATPSRFAGVKSAATAASDTGLGFCEKRYPATGPTALRYAPPKLVTISEATRPASKSWRWINVWATWCTPCVEEMGLLRRWSDALAKDGVPVGFELVSIDEKENEAALRAWAKKPLPGPVQWLAEQDDFEPLLKTLGLDANAAVPIHALVDSTGAVRCVRVGAIHDRDYGAVRALLQEG